MPYRTLARALCGAVFVLLLQLAPALAQEARFVATFGSDANICTLATPCRTLQRAHDVFPATSGYKIVVLDSGEFFPVTITKSIAIAATGVHANLIGGTSITINAGPTDVVYLDGLAMGRNEPAGDTSGIRFNSGARLHVRNCAIRNFGTAGIYVQGAGSKRVFISDCTIANNFHGVFVKPAGASSSTVQLDRVTIEGNSGHGIRAVENGAVVRVGNSTITDNNRGLSAGSGGTIISFGNNAIHGNNANGAPTSTVSLK